MDTQDAIQKFCNKHGVSFMVGGRVVGTPDLAPWTWKEIAKITEHTEERQKFFKVYGIAGVLAMKIAVIAAGREHGGICYTATDGKSAVLCQACPVYGKGCSARFDNYPQISAGYATAYEAFYK
jgi:hypothetical protein